ncbi:MAG TPA: acyl-CoA dehydrogenase family protein [Streptosporangiaceae bacterium]|nr:acyl-CoA dehydrogenase family protein [Streptosporangiaceae bacterium]
MTDSELPPLNEDQRALQDTLRAFLADQLPPQALRAALETQAGYSQELHARLAGDLGLAGLMIPAEFGGFARSQAEASVMHTELGRALYPGPFLPSALTAGVLLATGNREAQEQWLPHLAKGSVTGTVAAAGEAGFWAPGPDMVRAVRAPGGWRLYGHRWFVVAAHVADIVVVPAITDDGLGVFLAETRVLGFTASGQLGLDLTRRVCVTAFDEVPAVLLARDEIATAALEQAERDFLLATAAEAVGGIGWCLDAAIAYARDREQFGSPNGSFAALAQACVDMLAQFQEIAATARSAAITAAEGSEEAAVAAHVAALRAGEAYRTVTESATKLFGGVGVSWEHDAHLYYRRAWSADRLSGGPQAHRAAIIDLHGPVGLAGL